jgi:hypothetical protein
MGKIARRMRQLLKQTIHQPVVPLQAFADGKKKAQENIASVKSLEELSEDGYDPLHAIYVHAQNRVSLFAEDASTLPPLHVWNDFAAKMEDEYCPGYPPMSPITKSFCYLWELFDVSFGEDRETIGSVFIAMAPDLGVDLFQLAVVKKLSTTRMGIYEVIGITGKQYELTELLTEKKFVAMIPSGYAGKLGDLLYLRLASPLVDMANCHVCLTTPYVLLGTSKGDWISFFERNEIKKTQVGYEARLHRFLKQGKNRRYWTEFVFNGYFNHTPDRIFLTGIPDRPETLPHANEFDESQVNYLMIESQVQGVL